MIQYTHKEFITILKKNGYEFTRQTGSHSIYTNSLGKHITVPKNLRCVITTRLIKENNLMIK